MRRSIQTASIVGLALACFAAPCARAQAAGGFSAGPGLATPQAQLQLRPAKPSTDGGEAPEAGGQSAGPGHWSRAANCPMPQPGNYEVEQGWTGQELSPKLGGGQDSFYQTEIEAGVVPHLQMDLYLNLDNPPHSVGYDLDGLAVEIRCSIARDYGVIIGAIPSSTSSSPPSTSTRRGSRAPLLGGGDLILSRPRPHRRGGELLLRAEPPPHP